MIDARTNRLLPVAILLFAGSLLLAAEPNEIVTQLTFEDSPTGISWTHEGSPRPTHAAGITLHRPADIERTRATERSRALESGRDFVRYCLGRQSDVSLSQEQEAFLRAVHPSWPIEIRRGRLTATELQDNDTDYYSMALYAVSREDAQKMAEAYVKFAMDEFRDEVRKQTAAIQRRAERIASAEKRLPELEELLQTARASFEEIKKQVPYRSDEQSLEAAGELDKMLNTAQVEIAGIRAKIEAIQSWQAEKSTQAVSSKLEVMFVEEAIALRAAEARKRAATDLRTQADRFIDLNETIRDASAEMLRRRKSLPGDKTMLQSYESQLAKLKKREPKVIDNKVFIYPVEQ